MINVFLVLLTHVELFARENSMSGLLCYVQKLI